MPIHPRQAALRSDVIIKGVVRAKRPAEWSTPDGRRPAQVRGADTRASIYTPLLVDVELYLKGLQSAPMLLLYTQGGKVGEDAITYSPRGEYDAEPGQQMIAFLSDPGPALGNLPPERRPQLPTQRQGQKVWLLSHSYWVRPDGQATAPGRTMTLDELLTEIRAGVGGSAQP